jgi:hypothetical protein
VGDAKRGGALRLRAGGVFGAAVESSSEKYRMWTVGLAVGLEVGEKVGLFVGDEVMGLFVSSRVGSRVGRDVVGRLVRV